jgi:hypothetical protein
MTRAQINRALRPLGVEIQHQRFGGYSYFTSRRHGHQIGESVFVCYLSSLTLSQWVELASGAIKEHRRNGSPFAYQRDMSRTFKTNPRFKP